MSKILVTGGSGFIGTNLVIELRKRGHEVWVCDLRHSEDPNSIRCDVAQYHQLARIFDRHDFDYVYHLAAYAAEGLSHFIRRFNYTNNIIGSVNLINAAVRHQVKCLVFTSSIAVYGTNQLPMQEDLIPFFRRILIRKQIP